MEIIGLPHEDWMVRYVDDYLTQRHPQGIGSLLVELPPNGEELSERYPWYGGGSYFFLKLARMHEARGTRVIYGDVAVESLLRQLNSKAETTLGNAVKILWSLHTRIRDNAMAKSVRTENPEVAVVGTGHAIFLKKSIPESALHQVRFTVPASGSNR